jgi:DNA-binding Lrp family transcriptional regulator
MESPASIPRRPRFRRVTAPAFALTDRDVAIIRAVEKHRFLRSSHVAALLGASPQPVLRRLQRLYHAGYLDRPRAQIDYYRGGGSQPLVYGLGNAGADLLAQSFGVARGRIDWTSKNREVGALFLQHTLLIADVMVGLAVGCRANGRVRVIEPGEILAHAPAATRRRRNPIAWNVRVVHERERHTIGVIPDKVFGLHFLDAPEGQNRAYFFLEADRGTMPVERKTFDRTSFFRKLLAYHETWRQQIHTQHFGIKSFRVLTVTSSPERVRNIAAAASKATNGKALRLFLFADQASLIEADPLALTWRDASSGLVRLTD